MWRELLTDSLKEADVVILGVPIDCNCSVGKGASDAPKCLRRLSSFLPPYSIDGNEITTKVFDAGDAIDYSYESIAQKMQLGKDKKLTIMIGGDHSVSILSQKAAKELYGKVGIIHLDAHADVCDEYMGSKYSHACVNRRALDNGYGTEDIAMVGLRSFEKQEKIFLSSYDLTYLTANDVIRLGADKTARLLCEKFKDYDAVYVSFDIDCVDPSAAPGTGTPEAFGLSPRTLLEIIMQLFKCLPVKVFDLVEVSPPLDCNNITSWLALKYILEILAIIKGENE